MKDEKERPDGLISSFIIHNFLALIPPAMLSRHWTFIAAGLARMVSLQVGNAEGEERCGLQAGASFLIPAYGQKNR